MGGPRMFSDLAHKYLKQEDPVHQPCPPLRTRSTVACGANRKPRTYRLDPRPAQQAAYRRLAVAILGLDVRHLAAELRTVRAEISHAA
jgi:hypothetical protein